jgi:hypothetical protein
MNAWDFANKYGEFEIAEMLCSCALPFMISAKSCRRF